MMRNKNRSKVIKCSDYQWDAVPRKEYKDDSQCYRGVHRYSLLGEADDEQQLNFQTRYFEVEPGGYTSFEIHRHPHSVIIIRGAGEVVLGNELHQVGLHDVIFVAPETPHQFHATGEDPLGFICIVDRYRDRPTLPGDEFIKNEITDGQVREKIKR
ncbi:cupin domain-containing protein [Halalkalibaculum sp. DA3122]|uniref:cupin domain-containing protein n=1 Tax=Halalkalibaculum sp. DA3122 TaxID=3373607 RepID=UPI0037549D83